MKYMKKFVFMEARIAKANCNNSLETYWRLYGTNKGRGLNDSK